MHSLETCEQIIIETNWERL